MSQPGISLAASAAGASADDEACAQAAVSVYSCSRLGRIANPPSFSFTDLFRGARRR